MPTALLSAVSLVVDVLLGLCLILYLSLSNHFHLPLPTHTHTQALALPFYLCITYIILDPLLCVSVVCVPPSSLTPSPLGERREPPTNKDCFFFFMCVHVSLYRVIITR